MWMREAGRPTVVCVCVLFFCLLIAFVVFTLQSRGTTVFTATTCESAGKTSDQTALKTSYDGVVDKESCPKDSDCGKAVEKNVYKLSSNRQEEPLEYYSLRQEPGLKLKPQKGIKMKGGLPSLRNLQAEDEIGEDGQDMGKENNIFEDPEALNEEMAFIRKMADLETGSDVEEEDVQTERLAKNFMDRVGTDLDFYKDKAKTLEGHMLRRKRFIVKSLSLLWQKGVIPYNFTESLPEEKKTDYTNIVFKFYQKNSCLRIVPLSEDPYGEFGLTHTNFLSFVKKKGCFSNVGNVYRNGQPISCCSWVSPIFNTITASLGDRVFRVSVRRCFSNVGNVYRNGQPISCCSWKPCLHEMGHAIGFPHEQNNPIRDDYVRINYENIMDTKEGMYTKESERNFKQFGYYDYSSIMHYYMYTFTENKEPSMTLFDPEMLYIVDNPDIDGYYLLNEINSMYGCTVDCPRECINGGYMAWRNGKCRCNCPRGLTSQTGCATISGQAKWPDNHFTLLRPKSGCPDGFEPGWKKHWAAVSDSVTGTVSTSENYQAGGQVGLDNIVHEFCTKTYDQHYGTTGQWSAGKYCFLKDNDECPDGFQDGSYRFDDRDAPENVNVSGGHAPDGVLQEDMTLTFCCRVDGAADIPIILPTQSPFIMFKFGEMCQRVQDMEMEEQSFTFKNDVTSTQLGEGTYPSVTVTNTNTVTVPYCYYTPMKDSIACGGVIELSSAMSVVTIRSPAFPEPVEMAQMCTWFVKAPEDSKIRLTFPVFSVRSKGTECVDTVTVHSYMPGMPGIPYCGESFKKTVITRSNTLLLILEQKKGPEASNMVAEVRLLSGEDTCYRGSGEDYRGTVNVTQSFRACLHWDSVQHCRHHRNDVHDVEYGLEGNYCRNPGSGTGPWCYTNAETCTRDYCDVCRVSTCLDMAPDCTEELQADPGACTRDPAMTARCLKTCGVCSHYNPLLAVAEVRCSSPTSALPQDAEFTNSVKTVYFPGEEVPIKCKNGHDTTTLKCGFDGTWEAPTYVCGVCQSGWSFFNRGCYRLFIEFLTENEAEARCGKFNSGTVTTSVDQSEHEFLQTLLTTERGVSNDIWLHLFDVVDGVFTWADGSPFNWTNWNSGQPEVNEYKACVMMLRSGYWVSKTCTGRGVFVCKYKTDVPEVCSDQWPDCEDVIRRNPTFCEDQAKTMAMDSCLSSCALCPTAQYPSSMNCTDEGMAGNATVMTSPVSAGHVIYYTCSEGYVLTSGNLARSCLISHQLTGSAPVCKSMADAVVPVNNIDMRRRRFVVKPGKSYLALNPSMSISKSGFIVSWSFYSNYDGTVALQIWRPTEKATKFTLIGQTVVTSTRDDRKQTIVIPQGQRTPVTPGDLLGFYLDLNDAGGIPYDKCSPQFFDGENWKISGDRKSTATNWNVGANYNFKTFKGCYKFSLNAEVGPV